MNYELVSLVLVLAVAGGLILGAGMQGGFFSAVFSPAQSPDDSQISGSDAEEVDTSGFGVNIKGSGGSEKTETEPEDVEEAEEVTAPPITGTFGGSGGSPPDDTDNGGEEEKTALVSVDAPESVSLGSSFSVDVKIDTDARVYAIQILLEYEKDVINATDVKEGSFLGSNSEPVPLEIDNDAGTVEYINTRISPQEGREPGSGTLITVTFEALTAKDKTSITITEKDVIDENVDASKPVIITTKDGELSVVE
jgi:hypothetical protein